jgi:hypothetical protein
MRHHLCPFFCRKRTLAIACKGICHPIAGSQSPDGLWMNLIAKQLIASQEAQHVDCTLAAKQLASKGKIHHQIHVATLPCDCVQPPIPESDPPHHPGQSVLVGIVTSEALEAVLAQVFFREFIRAPVIMPGGPAHSVQVAFLSACRKHPQLHIISHPLTQRCYAVSPSGEGSKGLPERMLRCIFA